MNVYGTLFLIAVISLLLLSGTATADTIANPGTIADGERFVIREGDSLTIDKDETLKIENGAGLIIESGASLVLRPGAAFELASGSSVTIDGTLSNYGKIRNYGTIDNHGLIINYEINLVPVVINNHGIINDYGTIKNYGIINGEINSPPNADAGGSCTATVNAVIEFNGTDSSDIDGTIRTYQWDFGDRNDSTADSQTAFHTYTREGIYEVTLTVIDDQGAVDTDRATVTVTNPDSISDPTGMTLGSIPVTIPMTALFILAFLLRHRDQV
ncbi:MAG: PKD domain-containing protein [Methanosarcinaceae archaeon]|nr:PKD domain-containing protein [Methanosarcinaceae archaeon]